MRSYLRIGALTAVAAVALSGSVHAAPLTLYTSQAAFNAATIGDTAVNFDGIAPTNGFVTETIPPGLTIGGINFSINTSQSNGSLFVVDQGLPSNLFGVTLLDAQFSTATNDNILITLPTAVTAAAFDFGSNEGLNVNFLLSNGDTTAATTTAQVIQFLGVTSSTPFTTIEFSEQTGGGLVLKDFTMGTAVPEPASLMLLGSALVGFGSIRRRRRQVA